MFRTDSTSPFCTVTDLKDPTDYRIYVIPVNMKGAGQPQSPQGTFVRTLTAPQPITAEKPNFQKETLDEDNINPVMVIVFGGASGFLLILVTITLAVRVRCNRRANLPRENSKVIVTTIADLDFHDDHLNDRVPLRSSKSGLTSSCSQETGKEILELEGSPQSGYGSGESGRVVQPDYHQRQHPLFPNNGDPVFARRNSESIPRQQDHPYLMFPPGHNFCTLRKPGAPAPTVQFSDPPECSNLPTDTYITDGSHRRNFVESADEIVAQYREKQKAGFMYGTLRHPRIVQTKPGHEGGPAGYGTGDAYLAGGAEEHTCGGTVVPPPPMFEEGNMSQKTPLIGKKGKEKKDKMESRV